MNYVDKIRQRAQAARFNATEGTLLIKYEIPQLCNRLQKALAAMGHLRVAPSTPVNVEHELTRIIQELEALPNAGL